MTADRRTLQGELPSRSTHLPSVVYGLRGFLSPLRFGRTGFKRKDKGELEASVLVRVISGITPLRRDDEHRQASPGQTPDSPSRLSLTARPSHSHVTRSGARRPRPGLAGGGSAGFDGKELAGPLALSVVAAACSGGRLRGGGPSWQRWKPAPGFARFLKVECSN